MKTLSNVIRCILIEDEQPTRLLLRSLLENYCSDVLVVGEAQTVQEGVELIQQTQPDLVFLDIALPGESGLSLYQYFETPTFQVVFTTAYNQYAIRAVKLAALDYLLKPIDLVELMDTLKRFRARSRPPATQANHQLLEEHPDRAQQIALPCSDGYLFVPIADIIRCQSERSYTMFYIKGRSPILTSQNLGEYTTILQPYGFQRVHRSHLINPNCIKRFIRSKHPTLIMIDDSQISVSNAKREELLSRLLIP